MNTEFGNKTIPHIDLLFTYALLISGENRKAEKILLQTFAKAFWFWKHLSEETDIKLWLIRIMMNIFRSLPENNKSVEDQNIENKTIDVSSLNVQDINTQFDYKSTERFRQLISSLPLTLKEVIIFADALKFSNELVADLIEVPEDVIRKRLFDARKLILFGWLQYNSNIISTENVQIGLKEKLLIINLDDKNERGEFNDGTRKILKQEFEAQNLVKNIIAINAPLQPVRQPVKIKIIKKYAAHLTATIKTGTSSERRGIVTVATIAMIVLITLLIILFRPTKENPGEYAAKQMGEDNILVQLKNNYSLFVDGKFNTDMIVGDESMIKDFLSTAGFQYESILPRFTGWNVKSLFLTLFKEVQLTNFIYENEVGRYLYLYQIPLQLADDEQILQLTAELMDYLDTNNCYSSRNEATLYLLKKTESHILGFVLEEPKKELILEICRKP